MTVYPYILSLLDEFVQHFTTPGFAHFTCFMLAHMTLLGPAPLRHRNHAPDRMAQAGPLDRPLCLLETRLLLLPEALAHAAGIAASLRLLPAEAPLILALDDTLIKKWGRKFFGLGRYPDPTDKNPGAHKRKVWGHCWVVAALLYEKSPRPVVLFSAGAPCCLCPAGPAKPPGPLPPRSPWPACCCAGWAWPDAR